MLLGPIPKHKCGLSSAALPTGPGWERVNTHTDPSGTKWTMVAKRAGRGKWIDVNIIAVGAVYGKAKYVMRTTLSGSLLINTERLEVEHEILLASRLYVWAINEMLRYAGSK